MTWGPAGTIRPPGVLRLGPAPPEGMVESPLRAVLVWYAGRRAVQTDVVMTVRWAIAWLSHTPCRADRATRAAA